jgi:hypothetical protein
LQLKWRGGMLLSPKNDELRREPGPQDLKPLNDRMTGSTQRNHQRLFRNARHPVMDHDVVTILLRRLVKAPLTRPVISFEDCFAVATKILPIMMLSRQTSCTHAVRRDL